MLIITVHLLPSLRQRRTHSSILKQSTYHNWIRSDYYTREQLLSIYKKTAQQSDLTYANLTNEYPPLIQLTLPA